LAIIALLQLDNPVVQESVLIDQPPDVIDHAVHLFRKAVVDAHADFVERHLAFFPNADHLRFHLRAKVHNQRCNIGYFGRHELVLSPLPF
jgi:hypothetical protein